MLIKTVLRVLIIMGLVFLPSRELVAGEFPEAAYRSMLLKHEKFLASIKNNDVKKAYFASHLAFIDYFESEKENLGIFDEELKIHGKVFHIYRDNLQAIIDQRELEINSLARNNSNWLSQKTREHLMRSFKAVNQRVPYDRGEPLRPSFRAVDRAWKSFVERERAFYLLLSKKGGRPLEDCTNVLYEARAANLYREYKGVIAIKIEKED